MVVCVMLQPPEQDDAFVSVAFIPTNGGTTLIAATRTGYISLWNWENGREVTEGHGGCSLQVNGLVNALLPHDTLPLCACA